MAGQPTWIVTFLFTDIAGSTRLLRHLRDHYADVLTEYRRLLRAAFREKGGHEIDTPGDAFFVAFDRTRDAVAAAVAAQRAVAAHSWPRGVSVYVRMGLHTGEPALAAEGYVGLDVHRAARICAAGWGGQVLLSEAARALVEQDLPEGVTLKDLGVHHLKDLARDEHIFQLVAPDLPAEFPPIKSADEATDSPSRKIRVLLGDDQRLLREGLRTILETEGDFEVVGEAADGVEAVELSLRLEPDLVLLDIRMPRMDGVEATRRIRAAGGPQVVILSTYDDDEFIFEALKAGAVGYLLKDFPAEELIKALRTVHHGGGVLIPPPIAAKVVEEMRRERRPDERVEVSPSSSYNVAPSLLEPLTQREEEILRLLARGRSNKEIAEQLFLSEGTVKNYISRIYAKLGARDRTQAALWAVEHGLLKE